jgi:peptidyl-prolyl cis-trans isomerase D
MLRFFQNYHKSAIGLFVAVLICISMLGFGVGLGGQSRSDYVLKVNDQEVSSASFFDQQRTMMAQYRRLFGDSFFKFDEKQIQRIKEQFVDTLIDRLLLNQFAGNSDIFVGDDELKIHLQSNVFGGNFNPEQYRSYLQQIGKSGRAFEDQLRSDLLQQTVTDIIDHSSRPSQAEALALLREAETTYAVEYVEITPDQMLDKVSLPDDEALKQFYTDNGIDFEKDPRVKYDYVALNEEDFRESVEVLPEDVELYYAEHQKEFRTPEERLVKHIQLTYPAEASTEQMTELKDKALLAHSRASSGEDFDLLVQEYSDDIPTKVNNGSFGKLRKGDKPKELDSAIFALEAPGIAELVEVDYGFHIVKIEEIQPAGVKELDEVRDEIVAGIRKREAASYMFANAEDLLAEWRKSALPLKEYIVTKNLAASSTSDLLSKETDPATELRGLTGNVLSAADETQQLVDLANTVVLVDVQDFREAEVPPFEEIKEEVIAHWKKNQSAELALKNAVELAGRLGKDEFAAIAASSSLEIKKQEDLKPSAAFGVFGNPEVRAALFRGDAKATPALSRYFEIDEKFYLFSVSSVVTPDKAVLDEKLESYRTKAGSRLAQNLRASIINKLKAESEVEILPGAMS